MLLFLCSLCVAYLFGPTPTANFGIFHCPACGYKNSHNYSSFRGRDKSTKHLSYFLKYCALAVAGTHGYAMEIFGTFPSIRQTAHRF